MHDFRYRGTARDGQTVTGEIRAVSSSEARQALEEQGIRVLQCDAISAPEGTRIEPLSAQDALEWSQQLVQVASTQRPLAAGLRAAAEESSNARVASGLNYFARELEQGKTLEQALASAVDWIPAPLSGLLSASARTGSLAAALGDLVEHQRSVATLRRRVLESFAYSLIVACLSSILILLLLFVASRAFEKLFRDFNLQLPLITQLLFWWRDVGMGWVLLLTGGLFASGWLYRRWRGDAAWMRLLASIPVIGVIWQWLGFAECAGLLSMLTRYEVPLPEALRLCSRGMKNAALCELANNWASGVAGGHTLALALAAERHVPAAAVPLVAWGESTGQLPEALATVREMCLSRVEIRAEMLQAIVPPILFVGIGCFVLLTLGGLFMPMAALLQGLS